MTTSDLLVLGAAASLLLFGMAMSNIRSSIVVTMSMATFTMTWNDIRVGIPTVSDMLLLVTIGLVLISPLPVHPVRKMFGGSQKSLTLYAAILFAGGLIGGVLRRETDLGLTFGIRFAVAIVVTVFVVSALATRRRQWERYAMWYVLGATVNGLVAVTGGEKFSGRSIGLTNHPNHLGLSMLLAFFFAVAVQGSPLRSVRYSAAACVPVILLALVTSGSRGALLALMIGLVVLVLMGRGRAVPWMVGLGFVGVVTLLSLPSSLRAGPSAVGRLLTPTRSEAKSGALRLSYYEDALDLIQANPVVGEGFSQALVFHSVPLQLLVIGGLAGIVALFVLIRASLSAIRYSAVHGRPILERSCGAALVAIAFFLLTENILFDRYYLFFVSMAFLACSTQFESRRSAPVTTIDEKVADPV